MPGEEGGVGVHVTLLRSPDELAIVVWPAHHHAIVSTRGRGRIPTAAPGRGQAGGTGGHDLQGQHGRSHGERSIPAGGWSRRRGPGRGSTLRRGWDVPR